MSHNPEAWAAAYLGGAMRPSRRQSFEAHLLGCDDCWQEVRLARQGRRLAEEAREIAPPGLRERIRAAVAAEHTAGARGTGRHPAALRGLLLAVAAATAAVVASAAVSGSSPGAQAGTLAAAAVRDYTAGRLPGIPLPWLVPGLASLGLRPDGGGIGRLGGRELVALGYRDARGRRVAVYLTGADIPAPPGFTRLDVAGMGWTATMAGVRLICVSTVLVVGRDPALVAAVARTLNPSQPTSHDRRP